MSGHGRGVEIYVQKTGTRGEGMEYVAWCEDEGGRGRGRRGRAREGGVGGSM